MHRQCGDFMDHSSPIRAPAVQALARQNFDLNTVISISAVVSQLPCFGVFWTSTLLLIFDSFMLKIFLLQLFR